MSITITKPASGATLSGTVAVEATFAGQNFDIATVTFNGQQVGSDSAQPIAFQVDTTKVVDGARTLTVAVRYRTAGGKLRWQKASIPVTVKNVAVPPPPPPPPPSDTVAPSVPVLSLGAATNTSLVLNWQASTDAVGVDHYNIYRGTGAAVAAQAKVAEVPASARSYTYTGLTIDTDYSLAIEAVDAAGNKSALGEAIWWPVRTSGGITPPPPPPPPPPPTGGIALDTFDDFANPDWTSIFVNKYREGWTNLNATGTAWDNGGGIFPLTDAQTGGRGAGFKFKVNANMIQPNSSGKCAFICDRNHLVKFSDFIGKTQDWSGYFMFPAAGNPNGFPSSFSGVLWEWHTESMSGNNINIVPPHQTPPGRLRFGAYDRATEWYSDYPAANVIQMDHWYKWRIQLKWSYGSDGFAKCWIDDVLLGTHTGPTVKNGEHPYLQFGFYAHSELSNECWHAGLTVA